MISARQLRFTCAGPIRQPSSDSTRLDPTRLTSNSNPKSRPKTSPSNNFGRLVETNFSLPEAPHCTSERDPSRRLKLKTPARAHPKLSSGSLLPQNAHRPPKNLNPADTFLSSRSGNGHRQFSPPPPQQPHHHHQQQQQQHAPHTPSLSLPPPPSNGLAMPPPHSYDHSRHASLGGSPPHYARGTLIITARLKSTPIIEADITRRTHRTASESSLLLNAKHASSFASAITPFVFFATRLGSARPTHHFPLRRHSRSCYPSLGNVHFRYSRWRR